MRFVFERVVYNGAKRLNEWCRKIECYLKKYLTPLCNYFKCTYSFPKYIIKMNSWTYFSMTSLLMLTVAHFTRPSFRHKNNKQPLKKLSNMAKFWLSKSIFYVKNYPNLSKKIFIMIFVIDIFFNFSFQTTLFSKMTSNFWQRLLNWTHDLKTF